MDEAISSPAWLVDPSGRHELRFWTSVRWSEHVCDSGVVSTDPLWAKSPESPLHETMQPTSASDRPSDQRPELASPYPSPNPPKTHRRRALIVAAMLLLISLPIGAAFLRRTDDGKATVLPTEKPVTVASTPSVPNSV